MTEKQGAKLLCFSSPSDFSSPEEKSEAYRTCSEPT